MNIRDRKKRTIRAALLKQGLAIARAHGVDAVTAKAVAERADLSPASYLNYFQSREDLLSEWVHCQIANAFAEALAASREEPSVRRVARAAGQQLATRLEQDAQLIASFWPRVRAAARSGARGADPDQGRALHELIERGQERGELRRDVDTAGIAGLLTAAIVSAAGIALTRHSDPQLLSKRIAGAIDLVLDGARKRNERVRVTGTSLAAVAPAPGAPSV